MSKSKERTPARLPGPAQTLTARLPSSSTLRARSPPTGLCSEAEAGERFAGDAADEPTETDAETDHGEGAGRVGGR